MKFLRYKKLNMDMEPIKECPICGESHFESISRSDKFDHGIENVICKNCSFVFMNPAPTKESLDDFYKNRYWEFYFSPEPSDKMLSVTKNPERAEYHFRYLKDKINLNDVCSFVDVGGGDGSFIKTLHNQVSNGEEFILVEPSDSYRKFAVENNSCTFDCADISKVSKSSNLRLISMIHCLEHISNPLEFLSEISDLMNEGDYLFIDVPDVFEYWHVSEVHVAHTNHFNTETLSLLLNKSGFDVVDVGSHSPIRHPKSVRGIFRKTNETISETSIDLEHNILKSKISFDNVNETAKEWHSTKNMLKLKILSILNIGQY